MIPLICSNEVVETIIVKRTQRIHHPINITYFHLSFMEPDSSFGRSRICTIL